MSLTLRDGAQSMFRIGGTHCELDSFSCCTGSEIVHPCLEARPPSSEVQGCELPEVGVGNVNVEGLTLVNEGASVSSHLYQVSLLNLPHCLVDASQVIVVLFLQRFLCLVIKENVLHTDQTQHLTRNGSASASSLSLL
jgi:hypothetical protein